MRTSLIETNKAMQQQTPNHTESPLDLLELDNPAAVETFLAEAHPADIADLLESLTPEQRVGLWEQVSIEFAGEVLAELSDGVIRDLVEDIDSQRLVESIKYLDIDDIADLIPNLPESVLADVLFAVDQDTRKSLGEVLAYPEDSAGGMMDVNAIAVRNDISLEVVIRFLRLKKKLPSHTDTIYLVDRNNQLTGILPIHRLITAPVDEPIQNHTLKNPVYFHALDDEQDVAKAFADYNLISAPVVDKENKLIGRITIDDVVDVIREQAEYNMLAPAGVKQDEDLFAPVTHTARNRALWLGVNLITALIGSWVIGQFEGTIQQLVALAVLMPIVASMGGNAGTQTLTVVIRGMSMGTISGKNVFTVLRKEFLVGSLNGLIWAFAIALIATFWYQDPKLGLIIAMAMITNLIMGALAGVSLPVILDRMGIDPALAGGVALTTVTDVVGYFSVLGLAALFLL